MVIRSTSAGTLPRSAARAATTLLHSIAPRVLRRPGIRGRRFRSSAGSEQWGCVCWRRLSNHRGVKRANLAAIDATTGMATAWNPGASGPSDFTLINVLKVHNTTVYAGGRFTTIGGQSRERLAALSTTTGAANAWNPAPDGTVNDAGDQWHDCLVGGQYTAIGGQNRNNLAAVDTTTGSANGWNPDPNGFITALALTGNTLYVGGTFRARIALPKHRRPAPR